MACEPDQRTLAKEQADVAEMVTENPGLHSRLETNTKVVNAVSVVLGNDGSHPVDAILFLMMDGRNGVEFFYKGCSVSNVALYSDEQLAEILKKAASE
jgi:hypothetical protein